MRSTIPTFVTAQEAVKTHPLPPSPESVQRQQVAALLQLTREMLDAIEARLEAAIGRHLS